MKIQCYTFEQQDKDMKKIVCDRLNKVEILIENLDKTTLIEFKEKTKKLSDSRQKSKYWRINF